MKRKGHIYERMTDWDLIKIAQNVSIKNKGTNTGVRMHKRSWMKNLVEIQQHVINGTMQTGTYKHMMQVSSQGKLRDIAKLDFHPSHIQHQLLVMASMKEVEASYIEHTYASRKGYGQHKGAETLNRWVQEYCREDGEYPVYLQLDICKYYENIPHSLLEAELRKRFKDRRYVDAMLEPVQKFAPEGRGIPLGIRPSQIFGNLALSGLDRMIKEDLKCHCYIRYLDDMVLLCRNKGEAHRFASRVEEWVAQYGFDLHAPKIDKVANGIDFLGYVSYPYAGMFWRTSDKKAWLKRRSRVTNKRRLREIDASAWGYVSHGNRHCKKLYRKMNGVSFEKLGINKPAQKDKNGRRIIEGQSLSMQMVLNKTIEILDLESGVETSHGKDRVVMQVNVMGTIGKLMVNAPMKEFFADLWSKGATRISTIFIDRGGKHYDFDPSQTQLLEVHNRQVGEHEGRIVFLDNLEPLNIQF